MSDPDGSDHLVLEGWITTREAAEMLGVTLHQVRHLAYEGVIEAKKIAHAWIVKRASVEAYATSDRRPGPKPRE